MSTTYPIVDYYTNENKEVEYYVNDSGEFHNESGPAYISYYENGNKNCEVYYINGKLHNIKGPALILYENGNIERNSYYLDGIRINVNSNEEFEKYVKRLNLI